MSIKTLLLFLFGHRPSIEAAYNSPNAVWVGLLFVISAGFAREYDGEDLLHEPWHVFLPLGASLVTSFLLYALLELSFRAKQSHEQVALSFLARYRRFLGLYWLTAPLAWLYAIPVEQYFSAGDAVRFNLSLLGIVSLWRVLLITRVSSILYSRSFWTSFFVVMLFADTVAMIIFWFTPLPILSVMGGIRLTESENVLLETGLWVRFLGTVSWPVWLIAANVVTLGKFGMSTNSIATPPESVHPERRIAGSLWAIAIVSIVVWAAILPSTQPQQLSRRHAERLLYADRLPEAIEYMSKLQRTDFPRHWDPPPRIGYYELTPALDLILILVESPVATDWVRELYREKVRLQLMASPHSYEGRAIQLNTMPEARLARYVETLKKSSLGPQLARYHLVEIEYGFRQKSITQSQKESLDALTQLAKQALPVDESALIED
jgi:hypothetical protein